MAHPTSRWSAQIRRRGKTTPFKMVAGQRQCLCRLRLDKHLVDAPVSRVHRGGASRTRKAPDGIEARLPLRWPKRETGKTASFLMPSRPVNTRTSDASNVVVDSRFLATSTITSSDRDQC